MKVRFVYPTPDTVWLQPESTGDVEWRLRHAPEHVTASDRMVAASALNALRELIRRPRRERERVIAAMRKEEATFSSPTPRAAVKSARETLR